MLFGAFQMDKHDQFFLEFTVNSKFVELGKLSHFKLMCSAEAIQQTTVELASAALAGANQVKWS